MGSIIRQDVLLLPIAETGNFWYTVIMKCLMDTKNWKRGQQFLGSKFPIIAGAMTWISDSNLVKKVSAAGGFGCLAAGKMPADLLENELNCLLQGNFNYGVNLITIAPAYQDHLDLVTRLKVPYVIFAGSFPRKEEIQKAKKSGAKVLCFASTDSIAQRMIDYGADALILEGSEAGGHIGHVSTIVLLQQVLFKFDQVPVFIAGGIATGKMIAHLFLMGAAGVQLGTIFAMSKESPAHIKFKQRYQKARSREAMATPQYDSSLPVVSVRAIKNKGTEDFGRLQLTLLQQLKENKISRQAAQYEVENFWIGALRRAVVDGDIANGSLMAGQSVGLIDKIESIEAIVNRLIADASSEYQQIMNTGE
jgi:enoyl-[acyl-carrier protein] reductase II